MLYEMNYIVGTGAVADYLLHYHRFPMGQSYQISRARHKTHTQPWGNLRAPVEMSPQVLLVSYSAGLRFRQATVEMSPQWYLVKAWSQPKRPASVAMLPRMWSLSWHGAPSVRRVLAALPGRVRRVSRQATQHQEYAGWHVVGEFLLLLRVALRRLLPSVGLPMAMLP